MPLANNLADHKFRYKILLLYPLEKSFLKINAKEIVGKVVIMSLGISWQYLDVSLIIKFGNKYF